MIWNGEGSADSYSYTNLYQIEGGASVIVKERADAAFLALAEWINEQQGLVERAFEARSANHRDDLGGPTLHLAQL